MAFVSSSNLVTTKLNVTTTQDVGALTGIQPQGRAPQVIVTNHCVDAIIKFGKSASVAADNTYTSDDLAAGNFVVLAGAVQTFQVLPDTTHVSAICEDGTTIDGSIWFTPGAGEQL